jgi:hypothetical protein
MRTAFSGPAKDCSGSIVDAGCPGKTCRAVPATTGHLKLHPWRRHLDLIRGRIIEDRNVALAGITM